MDGDPRVEPQLDSFSLTFPLPYRVGFIVTLAVWGWGLNLHGLHLCRIDVPSLIRYPSRTSPHHISHHLSTYRFATVLSALFGISITLFWLLTWRVPSRVVEYDWVSMTYLTWAVSQRPDIRDKLAAEVATLPDDFTEADTRELRYMEQVINETMRLHAAAPCSLARVVPPEGVSLGGYWIEGGTTVGCQGYSMHRDEEIFPDPDAFSPERWENPTKAMKEAFMPFGRGARTCVGSHLAMIEIRLGVALFFRKFPKSIVSTKEGMSDEDMKSKIYFLNSPTGKRCLIEG
ncbi:hypothetical protein NQ176_g8084 [Zarea fungicola]|uniref:Uncharacterized protein n=1 Tax=Zarea fungicola TaxID=93591 RepID=A0ACC1MVG4_9HYPO|nr:hypothetical protein NQ176_g8084 [Lecanicillium fungicola]